MKKMINENQPFSLKFLQNLKVEVGNGAKTRFWEDSWIQKEPLERLFAELYGISAQQNSVIANMGWYEGQEWCWVLAWHRELSQEEIKRVDELRGLISTHNPQQNKEDKLLWNGRVEYTVRAFQQDCSRGVMYDCLVCKVWMNLAPPKVELFMWLALLEKLNTKEMLWRKGILKEDQKRCTFCSEAPESCSHILMACPVSWKIWNIIAEDLGQKLSLHVTFREHYEDWMGRKWRNTTFRKLWCSTFFAVAWTLWLTRNEIVFQSKELDMEKVCNLVRWRVTFWSKAWKEQLPYQSSELARKFDAIPVLFHCNN